MGDAWCAGLPALGRGQPRVLPRQSFWITWGWRRRNPDLSHTQALVSKKNTWFCVCPLPVSMLEATASQPALHHPWSGLCSPPSVVWAYLVLADHWQLQKPWKHGICSHPTCGQSLKPEGKNVDLGWFASGSHALFLLGHGWEPQQWLVPSALAQERLRSTSYGLQHSLYGHAPPWVTGEAPGKTKAQIIWDVWAFCLTRGSWLAQAQSKTSSL